MTRPVPQTIRRILSGAMLLLLALAATFVSPQQVRAQTAAEGSATAAEAEAGASALDGLALQSLLEVLRNDAARQTLVDALEQATSPQTENGESAGGGAAEGTETPDSLEDAVNPDGDGSEPRSLGGRIAEFTQGIAEGALDEVTSFVAGLSGAGSVFDGLGGDEIEVLIDAFGNLFLVIAITVAVYLALRLMALPLFRRMGARAETASLVRTVLIFVGSTLLDVMIVVIAWGLGYAITLLAVGEYGSIGFRQALYLNAFLLVEMTKVTIRIVLSPASGRLRLINLSDAGAKSFYRFCNVVVSILGYGQLLVVPIVNRNVNPAAGLGVSALLLAVVVLFVVFMVVRHHKPVADWLARRLAYARFVDETDKGYTSETPDRKKVDGVLGSLIRLWHWFVLAFLAYLFVIVLTRPADKVFEVLTATGKVALAILLGSVIVGAFGRASARGVRLPDELNAKLPLLERRLNGVVPKILIVLRIVVAIGVVAFTFDAVGLADISGWLKSDRGLNFSGAMVSVAVILVVAAAIWLAFNSWIDYRLSPDIGKVPTSRERTLLTLFRNAATIALLILTLMFALSEIGINIGPLIASAGVLGLAIGFGAQKLVQDIITGVFIQLENAMNVGDVVTVGGTTGTVEKLTIRSVALRDLQGAFHIIPFSSLDMVSNYMREFAYFVCDMGIAYRENIDEAKQAMLDAFEELRADPVQNAEIMGDLEWFGVNALGDSAVVLRARIKTTPGKQWGVGRAYNEILKRIFDARGIEIPFPHQTLFFGESKDGRTQALRLQNVAEEDRGDRAAPRPAPSSARGDAPSEDAPPDADLGPEAGEDR